MFKDIVILFSHLMIVNWAQNSRFRIIFLPNFVDSSHFEDEQSDASLFVETSRVCLPLETCRIFSLSLAKDLWHR